MTKQPDKEQVEVLVHTALRAVHRLAHRVARFGRRVFGTTDAVPCDPLRIAEELLEPLVHDSERSPPRFKFASELSL